MKHTHTIATAIAGLAVSLAGCAPAASRGTIDGLAYTVDAAALGNEQWQMTFGDGSQVAGQGPDPKDGIYLTSDALSALSSFPEASTILMPDGRMILNDTGNVRFDLLAFDAETGKPARIEGFERDASTQITATAQLRASLLQRYMALTDAQRAMYRDYVENVTEAGAAVTEAVIEAALAFATGGASAAADAVGRAAGTAGGG